MSRSGPRSRPRDIAIVDGRGTHTYGELADDACRLATFLSANGVAPGAVVSVQLPNRYEAAVTAVATQGLGGVLNPLLPNYRLKELADVFTRARPRVIVTPAEHHGFDHVGLVERSA